MAVTVKTETRKNIKREKIIEAGSELFSRGNFHEVMMEEVARLASIAKGTLYNYFDSKEDLYFSIMVIRMEKLINSLKEKIKNESAPVDSLRSFVIHNYMFMVRYSCFFLMFQRDNLNLQNNLCAEFQQKKSGLKELLTDILASGKEKKIFRDTDSSFSADLILGAVYGAVTRAIDNNFQKDRCETERRNLFDFILKGVSSISANEADVLPLKNINIVITRSAEDSKNSADLFRRQGANVLEFPTLEVTPPESWADLDNALLISPDYLIFTSANAVRMFIRRCKELNRGFNFNKSAVIAIGRKTAAVCRENNIPVSIIPDEFSAGGLTDELKDADLNGRVILIPSSAIARSELPKALKAKGAVVLTPAAYNVAVPSEEITGPKSQELKEIKPEVFVFTSPSTFRNFLNIMNITEPAKYFNGSIIAAIGTTTKSEIDRADLCVTIMPDEYTMDGLLRAVIKHFAVTLQEKQES
ncbi:MAG: uroporphyrinogen-III synthase [Ignavibacteria bacterium]